MSRMPSVPVKMPLSSSSSIGCTASPKCQPLHSSTGRETSQPNCSDTCFTRSSSVPVMLSIFVLLVVVGIWQIAHVSGSLARPPVREADLVLVLPPAIPHALKALHPLRLSLSTRDSAGDRF